MTDESGSNSNLSRRRMLGAAAAGAGALWVAPVMGTLDASPAAASPMGCAVCDESTPTNVVVDGTGESTQGWCLPASNAIQATGTHFRPGLPNAANGTYTMEQVYCFSPACIARFNQPVTGLLRRSSRPSRPTCTSAW